MNELAEKIIANNKPGLIVFLVLILLSNLAFGLFSSKYRFNKYIVYTSYALFAVFCCLIAKFYHNFAMLFLIIYATYIILYVLMCEGNPLKSLFSIISYLIFFSIFYGFCFLLLFIEGPYGIALRWVFVVAFYALLETMIYLYLLPKFKKAQRNVSKQWPFLCIGSILYLAIIFMQVFYPFQLSKNNVGGIILFLTSVIFYVFVFIIIINSFATMELYSEAIEANDQLQQLATMDSLTELYNKNYLATYSKQLIEQHDKKDKDTTLVAIMDIDKFKLINDLHGHIYGDEVLKSVAANIKEIFKGDGYKCFRFGGDEFVVVATDKQPKEVRKMLRNLKEKLKTSLNISISLGMHYVDFADIDPIETAIKNADKALYHEKFKN